MPVELGEFENFYNLPPAWNRGLAPVQGKHLQLRPTRNRGKKMLPGNPDLLKCPFCGEEKEVMTLLSGNTIDGRLWSVR